jgi:bacteriocin-like protein
MALNDVLEKIKRIDQLIRMQATGNPDQFAQKLGIAKSTLYSYINMMKQYDAPIKYNDERKTFIYTYNGILKIGFIGEEITEDELKNIKGGVRCENYLSFILSSMTSN